MGVVVVGMGVVAVAMVVCVSSSAVGIFPGLHWWSSWEGVRGGGGGVHLSWSSLVDPGLLSFVTVRVSSLVFTLRRVCVLFDLPLSRVLHSTPFARALVLFCLANEVCECEVFARHGWVLLPLPTAAARPRRGRRISPAFLRFRQ